MPDFRRTPYAEDTDAHRLAAALGFMVKARYQTVEVYDPDALAAAGFVKLEPKPEYRKIAKAIEEGLAVPGARLGAIEYILHAMPEQDGAE